MIDLAVVHYHLLPGGVTSVIRDGLRAVLQHRPGLLRSIHLMAGRPEGVETVRAALRAAAADAGADTVVQATVDPLLDYSGRGSASPDAWSFAAVSGPDAVWWIHNHHVGKNTPFTRALLHGAARGDARVLLQIHDFPECGRIDGYQQVRAALGTELYPFGPRLRYAVINRRDHEALAAAGIPDACLHLLWNPVLPSPIEPGSERLAPLMPGGRRLWLYPVRIRRRKNVLEAGLLARLAGRAAVGVTLPASSTAEASYHRQTGALFRDGTLPGRIGFGGQPRFRDRSLGALAAGADAVVSSSIEEGFGYQFLHARQWRLPLIARDIDAIDGVRDLLHPQSTVLYDRLQCPLTRADRLHLSGRYRARLKRLRPYVPQATLDQVADQVAADTGGPLVDYSYLSVELQQAVAVRCTCDTELRRHRAANADLIERVRAVHPPHPPDRAVDLLERRFGAAAFAARAAEALSWPPAAGGEGMADAASVAARFAAAPYQRLLLDPL
ncbi:MAG: hypothetical protein OXQ31_00665 [Spirochaetaceae bacterium]|nr:hypothetical protein [Spirochaetaceae bacterium]